MLRRQRAGGAERRPGAVRAAEPADPRDVALAIGRRVRRTGAWCGSDVLTTMTNLASATVPLFPITTFITPIFEGGAQGQPVPFTQFLRPPTLTGPDHSDDVAYRRRPCSWAVLKLTERGRNEFGPPVLSKIPYINRLFRERRLRPGHEQPPHHGDAASHHQRRGRIAANRSERPAVPAASDRSSNDGRGNAAAGVKPGSPRCRFLYKRAATVRKRRNSHPIFSSPRPFYLGSLLPYRTSLLVRSMNEVSPRSASPGV